MYFDDIRKSTVSQSFADNENEEDRLHLDENGREEGDEDLDEDGGELDEGLDDEEVGLEVVGIKGKAQNKDEKIVDEAKMEASNGEKETEEDSRMEEEKNNLDEKKRRKVIEAQLRKSKASYSIKLAQQLAKEAEEQKRANSLPPRAGGVIKVSFNKREFKHPARESKREEEEEWLRKQAKAKAAKKKLEEEEGSMEFEDVERKARSFYQVGDLESALEVLNQGLRLFPESAALWSKRTTVQISLEEWEAALEDSEIALRLLQPEVPMSSLFSRSSYLSYFS